VLWITSGVKKRVVIGRGFDAKKKKKKKKKNKNFGGY
jgi:hypothetical protein